MAVEPRYVAKGPVSTAGLDFAAGDSLDDVPAENLAVLIERRLVVDRLVLPITRADLAALEERIARLEAAASLRTGREKH